MLIAINKAARPPRLAVLAYDICCDRRARQVRRILESTHHAKQYSVFEVALGEGEFHGILSEISDACDLGEDELAVWWPHKALRLVWSQNQLMGGSYNSRPEVIRPHQASNAGNFIICYDITHPDALRAIWKIIAPDTTMLQRSVYWLRGSFADLIDLFSRCAPRLDTDDQLWAYPLRRSSDLWRLGRMDNALVPISCHRWGRS